MGIKDLYKVLKDEDPEILNEYHLSDMTGWRFAVDISIFLNKYIKSAGDRIWMNIFLLLICTLKKHNIKAIFIFDGPNPPLEKKLEQEGRRAQTRMSREKLACCVTARGRIQLEYLPYNLEMDEAFIEECRGLISIRKVKTINFNDPGMIAAALNERISSLEKQTLPITDEHKRLAKDIIEMFGFPYFQADGEAETLCSYLVINEKADAVLTEDTDVLAYGTPIMLAFKNFKLEDEKVYLLHHESICNTLELSPDEFRDLCILLRCDYNKNNLSRNGKKEVLGIPPGGKKEVAIGAKKALLMIKTYRRLEEVEKYLTEPEVLIYRRCREIFTTFDGFEKFDKVPYTAPPNLIALDNFISEHHLTVSISYISKCWKATRLIFESSTEESSEDEMDLNFVSGKRQLLDE